MTTCRDFDVLLSLRAAGALEAAEAARVEEHLAGCARCRAEAAADAEALRLAALPPPGEAERRATATLARDALAALQRREARTSSWKRAAAAFAAVAAVLLAVLAPALLGRKLVLPVGAPEGTTATAAVWQEPDLDALWNDADVVDLDAGAAASSSDAGDAAVASLDYL